MDKMFYVWKVEGGEAEWEPAYLDDIAEWLSEGYGVFLDEELTKDARDMNFGWLTETEEYIDACERDDLFMPDMWAVVDSEDETIAYFEAPIPLTAEGRTLARQWQSDASLGYDLCYGKCKGLAQKYSSYDVWNLIKENAEYHK